MSQAPLASMCCGFVVRRDVKMLYSLLYDLLSIKSKWWSLGLCLLSTQIDFVFKMSDVSKRACLDVVTNHRQSMRQWRVGQWLKTGSRLLRTQRVSTVVTQFSTMTSSYCFSTITGAALAANPRPFKLTSPAQHALRRVISFWNFLA